MKTAAEFLPLTHAVKVLRAAFAGESLSGHVLSLVILAVLTAVCGGAGLVLFRRRKWA
jgi:ABC-type polysaccharide/polyol phosphate export permease